jgi:hypothetical protein
MTRNNAVLGCACPSWWQRSCSDQAGKPLWDAFCKQLGADDNRNFLQHIRKICEMSATAFNVHFFARDAGVGLKLGRRSGVFRTVPRCLARLAALHVKDKLRKSRSVHVV